QAARGIHESQSLAGWFLQHALDTPAAVDGLVLLDDRQRTTERARLLLFQSAGIYLPIYQFGKSRHRAVCASDAEPFSPTLHQRRRARDCLLHTGDGPFSAILARMVLAIRRPIFCSDRGGTSGSDRERDPIRANRTCRNAGRSRFLPAMMKEIRDLRATLKLDDANIIRIT